MNDNKMNAFDVTVSALREKGLNSDEILEELSQMFKVFATSRQTVKSNSDDVDAEIRVLLKEVGVPTNIKGYNYWVTAIKLYKKDPKMLMTKDIYPEVAKIHGDTPGKVERSMRHAVESAFNRCPPDTLNYVFGNVVSLRKGKASNSEFLTTLIEYIK